MRVQKVDIEVQMIQMDVGNIDWRKRGVMNCVGAAGSGRGKVVFCSGPSGATTGSLCPVTKVLMGSLRSTQKLLGKVGRGREEGHCVPRWS